MRMGMQQHSHSFLVLLLLVFIAGIVLSVPSTPRRSRVRRQNMKVRINASGDTIVMKFLRPNADTKLEGYILGYGSSMFSKQYIQLPENGQPYETEFDAEPKYLIAVQPIPTNDVKKHCTGKVELLKPLHLVIGSVTPTSVILSWGTLLKTPYEGNVMNDCLEDGHYTVRYRERHRKWNYQTCPTSDTVIDNLKPNAVYEFGVQPNAKDVTGVWSKPVIHSISSGGTEDKPRKIIVKRPIKPVKPLLPGPRPSFPQRHVHPNRTHGRPPSTRKINSKTTLAPTTTTKKESLSTPGPTLPVVTKKPIGKLTNHNRNPNKHPCPYSRTNHNHNPNKHPCPYSRTNHNHNPNKHPCPYSRTNHNHNPNKHPFPYSRTNHNHNPNKHPCPYSRTNHNHNPNKHPCPYSRTNHNHNPNKHPCPYSRTNHNHNPNKHPCPYSRTNHNHNPNKHPCPYSRTNHNHNPNKHPCPYSRTNHNHNPNKHPCPYSRTNHNHNPNKHPCPYSRTNHNHNPNKHPCPYSRTNHHPNQHTSQKSKHNLSRNPGQSSIPNHSLKPHHISRLNYNLNQHCSPNTGPNLKHNPRKRAKPSLKFPHFPSPHLWHILNHKHNLNRQEPPRESKPRSQAQPPKKIQAQPKPSPPKPQPQPGIHFQTRTYSDPTKVTPRQAVSTAPSPPEEGKPLPRPALATEEAGSYNQGTRVLKPSIAAVPRSPISSSVPQAGRNITRTRVPPQTPRISGRPFTPSKTSSSHSSSTPGATGGARHRGIAYPKHVVWPKEKTVPTVLRPINKKPNLVGKPSDNDKPMDLKQGGKESILKPFPLVTDKPKQERRQQHTTSSAPALNTSRFDMNDNSSVFSHSPVSDLDIMGKPRFVGPHVIYKTDKKPDEPCSITSSLSFFADEEGGDQNVTGPPRVPPTNLTVVTVEGCPSFVILDWQKSDNETREYEVVSTTKGPNGEEVSVLTTNQTHTAVENLKPESSYEFTVTPKNELGAGPSSDPVTFSTESADPRVSEHASGKDAIWSQFPFKSDDYSECNGKQYVKRTWYRKFVGIQLCNSLRYKLYMSDSLTGKFYNIGDQTGHGEDHCQFVDSFLDGRTGTQMFADQLPSRQGFYRAMRQEPVHFGEIGGKSHVTYVGWYECGTPIPGKW
ncbi:hypothetical protein CgunFtcFv8_024464 [Champsocephalus gunnari]|uniref:Fibronectin type-III domain-containing protein n=1 Tax=Champsocephalus gunnari TaxID=52237 RepID=A0AAN8HMI2_CHAGU|nr:hypothetical protein CgunFtcFv8_024464 [Champsocephalus gunnari]